MMMEQLGIKKMQGLSLIHIYPADTTTIPAISRMLWLANLLKTTLAGMMPENVTSTMVQMDTTANVV